MFESALQQWEMEGWQWGLYSVDASEAMMCVCQRVRVKMGTCSTVSAVHFHVIIGLLPLVRGAVFSGLL